MYQYDRSDNPPAPRAPLTIYPPPGVDEEPITVSALVDTGSDCTCLPYDYLASLQLIPNSSARVETANGAVVSRPLYSVDLEFHQQRFPMITVVEVPTGSEALMGRDIIRAFRIELNGPQAYLDILPPT
jgi:predicted aspartyl protease